MGGKVVGMGDGGGGVHGRDATKAATLRLAPVTPSPLYNSYYGTMLRRSTARGSPAGICAPVSYGNVGNPPAESTKEDPAGFFSLGIRLRRPMLGRIPLPDSSDEETVLSEAPTRTSSDLRPNLGARQKSASSPVDPRRLTAALSVVMSVGESRASRLSVQDFSCELTSVERADLRVLFRLLVARCRSASLFAGPRSLTEPEPEPTPEDEIISRAEFQMAFSSGSNAALIHRVYDLLCAGHEGVSFEGFAAGLCPLVAADATHHDRLRFLFEACDLDGSGYISHDELFVLLHQACSLPTDYIESAVEATIAQMDADEDGKLYSLYVYPRPPRLSVCLEPVWGEMGMVLLLTHTPGLGRRTRNLGLARAHLRYPSPLIPPLRYSAGVISWSDFESHYEDRPEALHDLTQHLGLSVNRLTARLVMSLDASGLIPPKETKLPGSTSKVYHLPATPCYYCYYCYFYYKSALSLPYNTRLVVNLEHWA